MKFKIHEYLEPTGNTGTKIYAIDNEQDQPIIVFHNNEDNIVQRCCWFLNEIGTVDEAIIKLFFRKIWSNDEWFNWYYQSLPEFMERYVKEVYV